MRRIVETVFGVDDAKSAVVCDAFQWFGRTVFGFEAFDAMNRVEDGVVLRQRNGRIVGVQGCDFGSKTAIPFL